MYEIEDFISYYPEIEDDSFNSHINSLKELHMEMLPEIEKINPEEKPFLFKIQKLIMKYMSVYTPYRGVLIFHEMGQGKTCSSIAAVENILNNTEYPFNKAMVITPSEGLNDNYIREIVLKCGGTRYLNDTIINAKNDKIRLMRKVVKSRYGFNTYYKFAKMINNAQKNVNMKNMLIGEFSNRIFVFDEIHNIREAEEESKAFDTYTVIKNFMWQLKNVKILILSGTPMWDGANEILNVMDFLVKIDPKKKKEVSQYSDEELKNIFKGRVSYLKAKETNIRREYVKSGELQLDNFNLYNTQMDPEHQGKIYKKTYEEEEKAITEERGGFAYNFSGDAILFGIEVYGEVYFGRKLYEKFINEKKSGDITIYSMDKQLKEILLRGVNPDNRNEKILANIRKYSSKYADIISKILDDEDKCVFVYSESVRGSGCILLSLLLELFGFKRAIGNVSGEAPRYALLAGNVSKTSIDRIKDRFNRKDNVYGNYIRVIIGSDKITEGYSFNHIQEEHIVTPWWNYQKIAQAVGRGLRAGSHDILVESNRNRNIVEEPVIRIYHHVSVGVDKEKNIDFTKYSKSSEKDLEIKRIERLIQVSAFDCFLTKGRNMIENGVDGSRECYYSTCDYTCEGEPYNEIEKTTNYNLYYIDGIVKNIVEFLEKMFSIVNVLSFESILSGLGQYTEFEIIFALSLMINNNVIIKDRYNPNNCLTKKENKCYSNKYLTESENKYFLVDDIVLDNRNYMEVYSNIIPKKIYGNSKEMIRSYINKNPDKYLQIIKRWCEKYLEKDSDKQNIPDEIKERIELLPKYVQDILIQSAKANPDSENIVVKVINKIYEEFKTELLDIDLYGMSDGENMTNPENINYFKIVNKKNLDGTDKQQTKIKGADCTPKKKPELIHILRKITTRYDSLDAAEKELYNSAIVDDKLYVYSGKKGKTPTWNIKPTIQDYCKAIKYIFIKKNQLVKYM